MKQTKYTQQKQDQILKRWQKTEKWSDAGTHSDRKAVKCYRSLQCSLCPRWQQTQACTDNAPASSEKSVSNCLWCWPTQAEWKWRMKTRWANIWIKCDTGKTCHPNECLDDVVKKHMRLTVTHSETQACADTRGTPCWPPGRFLWPWCQTGAPASPWPSGCRAPRGPRPADQCWYRPCRGGTPNPAAGHAATAPRCRFQTGLGWRPGGNTQADGTSWISESTSSSFQWSYFCKTAVKAKTFLRTSQFKVQCAGL